MQDNGSLPAPQTQASKESIRAAPKQVSKYFASLSERATQYLFPLFLLAVEWFLRDAFRLSTQEFIGPTLAATGVGMTITLTSYEGNKLLQSIPSEIKEYAERNNLRVETTKSGVFRNMCWIVTLVLTLLWIWSITLSTQHPNSTLWIFPTHYYPGFGSYIFSLFLSELKEITL